MKLLNKKAMTLFELLAVIVILGIVAVIAFPTVNRLIENQRKSSFAEQANLFVQNAVQLAEDEYEFLEYPEFTYFLNNSDDPEYEADFDISDEFPKMPADYEGKITFNVDDEELTITSITFQNDKYELIEPNEYTLTIRFNRSDVDEKE